MNTQTVLTGFVILNRTSPVTRAWGALYACTVAESFSLGLWLGDNHCNSRGFLHGGVIATLADIAMGQGYALALKERRGSIVTTSINIDYVSTAKKGYWLALQTRVIRAGSGTGFIDCLVLSEGQIIARANAVFRNLQK